MTTPLRSFAQLYQRRLAEVFGPHLDPLRFNLEFMVGFAARYLPLYAFGASPDIGPGSHMGSGVVASRWSSLLNHDCDPNAVAKIDCDDHQCGNDIRIVATRDILPGEEVTVSYIPATASYEKRTEMLAPYQFVCSCRRCVAERRGLQSA